MKSKQNKKQCCPNLDCESEKVSKNTVPSGVGAGNEKALPDLITKKWKCDDCGQRF